MEIYARLWMWPVPVAFWALTPIWKVMARRRMVDARCGPELIAEMMRDRDRWEQWIFRP